MHECKIEFDTEKIDECKGSAFNRCYGDDNLTLEVWFMDTDTYEEYFDNWQDVNVNYCPFCGIKAINFEH